MLIVGFYGAKELLTQQLKKGKEHLYISISLFFLSLSYYLSISISLYVYLPIDSHNILSWLCRDNEGPGPIFNKRPNTYFFLSPPPSLFNFLTHGLSASNW
eukprot:sb/3478470/